MLKLFFKVLLIFAVIMNGTYPSRILFQVRNRQLWKVTATNFFLVWTDQPGLYQFIGNLSLFPGVTTLDLDFSSTNRTIIFYLFRSNYWKLLLDIFNKFCILKL